MAMQDTSWKDSNKMTKLIRLVFFCFLVHPEFYHTTVNAEFLGGEVDTHSCKHNMVSINILKKKITYMDREPPTLITRLRNRDFTKPTSILTRLYQKMEGKLWPFVRTPVYNERGQTSEPNQNLVSRDLVMPRKR